MSRKDELLKVFAGVDADRLSMVRNLIDDAVYLEGQLDRLRTLPFIMVNPRNPAQQKSTPAAKQYKEMLQQYSNIIKLLASFLGKVEADEDDSPLRAYMRQRVNKCEIR
ncbi:MAG: hypothetical protein MJ000_11640 [Bacteroidales bacterium]|nr:hypothetical protein [Bacteroidales bacterium]